MSRRIKLIVEVDLDDCPGWGHEPEDWISKIQGHLDYTFKHYHPTVTLGEYQYRNLGCDIVPDDELWCVVGEDLLQGGAGVLEWCFDEYDAKATVERMQHHVGQFKDLMAVRYAEGQA